MGRLIDADALFDAMDFHVTSVSMCATVDEARGMTRMKQICLEDVKNAPTVDAVPVVHGKWEPVVAATEDGYPYQAGIRCSECGHLDVVEENFCPNCGAKMDGGKNDE